MVLDQNAWPPFGVFVTPCYLGFAFVVDLEYERIPPFLLFCKMINHMLSACRHYLQIDRSDQQVKS